MKTIQPSHEVMSLFDISSKTQALSQKSPNRGLILSIVSAFFIVAVLGLFLNFIQAAVNGQEASAALIVSDSEIAAFVPGQFVTDQISRGYLQR